MKYIIGFLLVFALILYLGFGETDSVVTDNVKIKKQNLKHTVTEEEEYPEADTQKRSYNIDEKDAVEDQLRSADAVQSRPKRKLVGGAEVEWIEPDTSDQHGAFGLPPE